MSCCKPVGFVLALSFVCFAFGLTIGLVWNASAKGVPRRGGCDPCPACNPKVVHDCSNTATVPHYWYLGENRAMVNLYAEANEIWIEGSNFRCLHLELM